MRQDLAGLNIARPVALLDAPRVGYLMELMDGLAPLTQLLEIVAEEGVEGYLRSGSLARRLQLLAKLASTLSLLHARGMAFGDLSPDNIYVSAELEHTELWLIDCDNISFESQPCRALYTPDYGAPELVRGHAEFSSLTDIWSFAIIAYRLLTGNHPLKGDMVNYSEPEFEVQALRGELPWIGHADDSRNATDCGIALCSVATGRLTKLFALCFEKGITEPTERPSMASWLEAVHEASERIVHCPACASSYLFNREGCCPFCEEVLTAGYVLFEEFQFIPPGQLPEWHEKAPGDSLVKTGRFVVLQPDHSLVLRANIPSHWYTESLPPLVHLEFSEQGLWIDPLQSEVAIQRESKVNQVPKRMKLKEELRGSSNAWFWLHIGEMDQPHLLWRFKW
jgi:serine/threonine protein kinase